MVVAVAGPHGRVRLAFRYDLPDPPDQALATLIADHAISVFQRERLTTAAVIGYGPGTLVTPVADVIRHVLPRAGIRLQDVLRVHEGRYWSYLCTDLSCCPAEGAEVTAPGAHPDAAMLTDFGAMAASRDALAATIAPVTGPDADAMTEATGQARQEAYEQAGSGGEQAVESFWLEAVRHPVATYRDGGSITDPVTFARLMLALTSLRIRDDAWARMIPEHRDAHIRLWTDLTRRARPGYVAAPASLLAFVAWQAGDGVLGNLAIDRALADDPGYSMALLIRDALASGLPPSAAVLSMTPEEVAASYHRQRRH